MSHAITGQPGPRGANFTLRCTNSSSTLAVFFVTTPDNVSCARRVSRGNNPLGGHGQAGYLWSVTDTERQILSVLIELETAVARMATASPKPNLLPIFQRLDELTRQLPPSTDPGLLHYLHKKSYEKARLYLQGRDAENQVGNCRHVEG